MQVHEALEFFMGRFTVRAATISHHGHYRNICYNVAEICLGSSV